MAPAVPRSKLNAFCTYYIFQKDYVNKDFFKQHLLKVGSLKYSQMFLVEGFFSFHIEVIQEK